MEGVGQSLLPERGPECTKPSQLQSLEKFVTSVHLRDISVARTNNLVPKPFAVASEVIRSAYSAVVCSRFGG